jgi:hypothetical protein
MNAADLEKTMRRYSLLMAKKRTAPESLTPAERQELEHLHEQVIQLAAEDVVDIEEILRPGDRR